MYAASIRAYGAESAFKAEARRRIDRYTRTARVFYNLNRWIAVRINAIGGLFSAGLAAYLVYGTASPASVTGFSLSLVSLHVRHDLEFGSHLAADRYVLADGMQICETLPACYSTLLQILWWNRNLNRFEVEGKAPLPSFVHCRIYACRELAGAHPAVH